MQSLHSLGANVSENYDRHLFNLICYLVVRILIYFQLKVVTFYCLHTEQKLPEGKPPV